MSFGSLWNEKLMCRMSPSSMALRASSMQLFHGHAQSILRKAAECEMLCDEDGKG